MLEATTEYDRHVLLMITCGGTVQITPAPPSTRMAASRQTSFITDGFAKIDSSWGLAEVLTEATGCNQFTAPSERAN